jgi:hypothetical protein
LRNWWASIDSRIIVLISPHAPLEPSAFVAYPGPVLRGNFANFSASAVRFEASLDDELLQAISKAAAREDYEVVGLASGQKLDHGTAVPLYFLQRNGWSGRVVALGYSFLSNEDHLRFGSCIGEAINEIGKINKATGRSSFKSLGPLETMLSGEHSHSTILLLRNECQLHVIDKHLYHAFEQWNILRHSSLERDRRGLSRPSYSQKLA